MAVVNASVSSPEPASGKSTLIEQIARQSDADIVVVGLIGERGREVLELASSERKRPHGHSLRRPPDRSAMERIRGAKAATAVAEYFARSGQTVLLLIDSLTRYAMGSSRGWGSLSGNPLQPRATPRVVFTEMPRLLERVRAVGNRRLDNCVLFRPRRGRRPRRTRSPMRRARCSMGHIILDRGLAGRGHFPGRRRHREYFEGL